MTDIQIFPDADRLADAAADHFVDLAARAIADRGRCAVALAGGSTPRAMLTRLARPPRSEAVDWARLHVFWGDERCVPPDMDASNYRLAADALLGSVLIPPDNIHRIRGEARPTRAALIYEDEMRAYFRTSQLPVFDLVLLGLGGNGHTASLFPGTAALRERERWAVAQYVEVVGMWRVTLTPPIINNAAQVTFLVAGADKAAALAHVLRGPYEPDVWPAQLIQPTHGGPLWLVDAAAAVALREAS